MNKVFSLAAILFWTFGGTDSFEKNIYKIKAFDIESGAFLYIERHIEEYSGNGIEKSTTEYLNLNGIPIARRIMNFSVDSTKPNFKLEDFRTGYLEGAELITPGKVKVEHRADINSKLETEIVKVEEPYVIDGGLTYFFRRNWNSLFNNKTVEFNFIVPSKLDYFGFRVSKNSIKNINGIKGMELKLEPSSFIIRQFVDPIFITYDLETKKILYYEGLSNINNDEGKSYNVRIDFTNEEFN